MKKIGLTLDDDTFNIISKISVNNEMTPTTICSLILKLRCQWYKNKGLPQFKTVVYENIKSQETTPSIQPNMDNQETMSWDEFFNEIEPEKNKEI